MDPLLFREDLEQMPASLTSLHQRVVAENPWEAILAERPRRIVLLGMGSSHFANSVLALRLQAHGIAAVAALASTDPLPTVEADDLVVAVSATGGSAETVAAMTHYVGRCRSVAVTNAASSAVQDLCDQHVAMEAGPEAGGVACRSFAHTLATHLELQDALTGSGAAPRVLQGAIDATTDLLATRDTWLPRLAELLLGPDGTAIVGPARRLSSAQQSALMLREGPRLPAIACETGDWSHIDVYLTKTTDYRMLLLAGSAWEAPLLDWCRQRGSTVVGAGADIPGAEFSLRYRGDQEDDVRLLAEPLIVELLAAQAWLDSSPTSSTVE